MRRVDVRQSVPEFQSSKQTCSLDLLCWATYISCQRKKCLSYIRHIIWILNLFVNKYYSSFSDLLLCDFYPCELSRDISSRFFRITQCVQVFLRFCGNLAEKYISAFLSFSQAFIGKLGVCAQLCFSFSFWCQLCFRDAWKPCHSWKKTRGTRPHRHRTSTQRRRQASALLAQEYRDVANSVWISVLSERCYC